MDDNRAKLRVHCLQRRAEHLPFIFVACVRLVESQKQSGTAMRGLAFPPNAVSDRETSYEYGTPVSNADDIPIDPALGGIPIDPAIMGQDSGSSYHQVSRRRQVSEDALMPDHTTRRVVYNDDPQSISQPQQEFTRPPSPPQHYLQAPQYSDAPQGDPFAPQPSYFPVQEEQPLPTPKPVKRKRKPRREEECGFCQGDDSKNKSGESEPMVTCDECGRSGTRSLT